MSPAILRARRENSPLYCLTLALMGWMLVFTFGLSILSRPAEHPRNPRPAGPEHDWV